MRKLIFAIALLLGTMFLIGQFAEMQAIVDTLKHGDWRFFVLALLVEALWVVNVAVSYRVIFHATEFISVVPALVHDIKCDCQLFVSSAEAREPPIQDRWR